MGAPTNNGAKYYTVRVRQDEDSAFRALKLQYGFWVPYVYEILNRYIIAENYFVAFDEQNRIDVVWDLHNRLKGRYQPTESVIIDVINGLVAHGFYDGESYSQGVITSKPLQEMYYRSYVERVKVTEFDFSHWLLSEQEMSKISERCVILRLFRNRPSFSENRPSFSENRPTNDSNSNSNSNNVVVVLEPESPKKSINFAKLLEQQIKIEDLEDMSYTYHREVSVMPRIISAVINGFASGALPIEDLPRITTALLFGIDNTLYVKHKGVERLRAISNFDAYIIGAIKKQLKNTKEVANAKSGQLHPTNGINPADYDDTK